MEQVGPSAPGREPVTVPTVMVVRLVLVSTVAIVGYSGFRYGAHLDLGGTTTAGLATLAVATGFLAFFSPCSFTLLIGLLAGTDIVTAQGGSRKEGLRTAVAVGTGAGLFFLCIGLIVGLVGEGVGQSVGFSSGVGRTIRATAAGVVIGAGMVQLGLIGSPAGRLTPMAQPIERLRLATANSHRRRAQMLYGFGFVVAGFG